MEKNFYKTRLRLKGQITVPPEIRNLLDANEGDDLLFSTDENGQVIISKAQFISPDQAWFWSKHWQLMEREAETDISNNRVVEYGNITDAISGLNALGTVSDAKN